MTYDSPYRDVALSECNDISDALYFGISANDDDDRVMSAAAYDVVAKYLTERLGRAGALCCRLNAREQALHVYLSLADDNDHCAAFELPFSELVLSAGEACEDYEGVSASVLSGLLRKLADKIDRKD